MCNVTRANISVGYKTDHSLITFKVALHSNQREPGFGRLTSSSFLSDINYVNQIRRAIQEGLAEYENDDDVNPALLWEMIKTYVFLGLYFREFTAAINFPCSKSGK